MLFGAAVQCYVIPCSSMQDGVWTDAVCVACLICGVGKGSVRLYLLGGRGGSTCCWYASILACWYTCSLKTSSVQACSRLQQHVHQWVQRLTPVHQSA